MRVAVVGGSIAGCSAAIELGRAGHEVTVFERSRGGLEGRGAGIGTPTGTFDALVSRDLIDGDTPRFQVTGLPLVGRKDAADRLGHRALTLPLDMALLNWGDLWRQLRSRVPDTTYVEGRTVTGIERRPDRTEIWCEGGGGDTYDLVLFADGYRSIGRKVLFPSTDVSYRGYVLWRGVLHERDLSDSTPLETDLYRLHYKGLPGNAVFYLVPGEGGSTRSGERWVNWACYLPVAGEDLADILVDKEGRRREHSLPPGSMRPAEEDRLKRLVAEHLPSYFAEIVFDSRDTFVQPIHAVTVPGYVHGRVGLLGDAGSIAPPFTGSGVFKAVMNSVDLVTSLETHATVDEALGAWSRLQTERGFRLARLGDQMEDAFVWNAPDFATMSEAEARDWWKRSITFPEEFSYVGSESDDGRSA